MKITAVTPLYPPGSLVGAWLATHEMLLSCAARGHDVRVVTSLANGPGYVHDGIQVENGTKWIREAVLEADVVVSHLGDQGTAHELAVKRGVPSVRIVHGLASPNQLKLCRVYPAALMVWNAESSMHAARWDGPSIVVRPPLRPERFRTTPGDRVTQVNVSDAKGGQLFGKLVRFMPDVEFLAVLGGYGKQRTPQGRNVKVVQSTPDMRRDVYSETRVVTIPSKWETWGMVGPEAMCSGIPVVAAPTPGLRESLGDAGVFVDITDFGGWLREVRRLLDPSEWAEASAKALSRSEELAAQDDTVGFVDALEGLL